MSLREAIVCVKIPDSTHNETSFVKIDNETEHVSQFVEIWVTIKFHNNAVEGSLLITRKQCISTMQYKNQAVF